MAPVDSSPDTLAPTLPLTLQFQDELSVWLADWPVVADADWLTLVLAPCDTDCPTVALWLCDALQLLPSDWETLTPEDCPALQLLLDASVTLWLVPVVVDVPCATPVVCAVLQDEPELWATDVLWLVVCAQDVVSATLSVCATLVVCAQELVSALLWVTPPP